MEFLKTIGQLFAKNLSNLLSILGIVATIYFGVFYVPDRIEEAKQEKLTNAQSELNQSIKELAFSDSILTFIEVQRLIEAKAIELHDNYPYSLQKVLTLAQESFMEDRFLPITNRKILFQKLEALKTGPTKESEILENKKSEASAMTIGSWISIIVALLIVTVGLYSIFLNGKQERERQEELENELKQTETQESLAEYAYQFEKRIINFLRSASFVSGITDIQQEKDNGIDFEFKVGEKTIYLYIKYYRKNKVGLKGIIPLIDALHNKKGEAWLIYSSGLTSMVKNHIAEFNKSQNEIEIKTLNVKSSEEFESKIKEILHTK